MDTGWVPGSNRQKWLDDLKAEEKARKVEERKAAEASNTESVPQKAV